MRIPTSTYRLQLRAGFGFPEAAAVVPYLAALGVGDVYVSPILAAVPGSAHGYDGVDPDRIDAERGGAEGLAGLVAACRAHGLGLLVDHVPNHLATHEANGRWWDVLRRGRASAHAAVFDIDWEAPGLGGRVLLPVLGAPLPDLVAAGELRVDPHDPRGPVVHYHDHAFPLAEGRDADGPLERLLDRQHYLLAFWREGPERVNYRRFFEVDTLICVRQEDEAVFAETHRTILGLVEQGDVTGLRIDHIDGLADPAGYLERLRAAAPGLYVVVEKILAADEELPAGWATAGTTGYEVIDALGSVLTDPDGAAVLEALFARVTGIERPFAEIALEAKRAVLAESFPADVDAVRRTLPVPGPGDREAIAEVTAQLDVYRTYGGVGEPLRDADRSRVERALARAAGRVEPEALGRLGEVLLAGGSRTVRRWQQLTGPAAAKGVEDTAIYRFPTLASRDEVGVDPSAEPLGISALHRRLAERAAAWPGALSPLSTHDTKRGEDTRARIGVLAALADRWTAVVERLLAHHSAGRERIAGLLAPSLTDELALYQALVGTWPGGVPDDAYHERIVAYMRKAAREGKLRTSWTDPDPAYDAALERLVARSVETFAGDTIPDLPALLADVAWYGALDGLAQALLRLAAPGVPDIYQGTELWSRSLVDPDNRRPVDYARRQELLARLDPSAPPSAQVARAALAGWPDGAVKLLVTTRALHLRRAEPELFARGAYVPLAASGAARRHVVAFARHAGDRWAVAIAPRLVPRIAEPGRAPLGPAVWGDTALALPVDAPPLLRDVLTGADVAAHDGRLPLADALSALPVALLVGLSKGDRHLVITTARGRRPPPASVVVIERGQAPGDNHGVGDDLRPRRSWLSKGDRHLVITTAWATTSAGVGWGYRKGTGTW